MADLGNLPGNRNTSPPAPPAAPGYTGPATNSRAWWAMQILLGLHAPLTPENIAFFVAWQTKEGGGGRNNPLNTTSRSGAPGESDFNPVGVKNYPDWQTGVARTVADLQRPYEAPMLNAVMAGNPAAAFADMGAWSTYVSGSPTGNPQYGRDVQNLYAQAMHDPALGAHGGTSGSGSAGTGAPASDTGMYVAGEFPQYAWLLHDPEVGPILTQASAEHWDANTFQNALQGTNWFKQHSSSAREWDILKNTDPATYSQHLGENTNLVAQAARNLGINNLSLTQIASFADQMGRFGWTPDDLNRHLIDVNTYKPGGQGGLLGSGMEQVRQTAADYGVNLNDRQAYNYSVSLAENLDPKGISATFANQAKALYPHLAPQLDQGLTLRDINAPYMTVAANLLDTNPNDLNQADPKFLRPLGVHDGKQVRQMTMDEWTKTVMSDPAYGWMHTTNARDAALNLAQSLSQTLGIAT